MHGDYQPLGGASWEWSTYAFEDATWVCARPDLAEGAARLGGSSRPGLLLVAARRPPRTWVQVAICEFVGGRDVLVDLHGDDGEEFVHERLVTEFAEPLMEFGREEFEDALERGDGVPVAARKGAEGLEGVLVADTGGMAGGWPTDGRRSLGQVVGGLEGAVGDVVEQSCRGRKFRLPGCQWACMASSPRAIRSCTVPTRARSVRDGDGTVSRASSRTPAGSSAAGHVDRSSCCGTVVTVAPFVGGPSGRGNPAAPMTRPNRSGSVVLSVCVIGGVPSWCSAVGLGARRVRRSRRPDHFQSPAPAVRSDPCFTPVARPPRRPGVGPAPVRDRRAARRAGIAR